MNKYIDNWFSNMKWLDRPIVYQGINFWFSENLYQALKLPKEAVEERRRIAGMNPYQAKRYAKKEIMDKGRARPEWNDEFKIRVMEFCLRKKFAQGTRWHEQLLKTGDEEIVEYNNWRDVFWGYDVNLKRGDNHLGKLLMKLREEFKYGRQAESPPILNKLISS